MGQRSSALIRSLALSLMILAELVYTRAFTPAFWQASMTHFVPSTLTLSYMALLPPTRVGDAVWITTSGLIFWKTGRIEERSVISPSK